MRSPTLSPRYSVMTAASDSRNRSAISETASTFSGFAMALLPEVSRHRVKKSEEQERPRHASVEASIARIALATRAPAGAGRARPCESRFFTCAGHPVGISSVVLEVERDNRRSSVSPDVDQRRYPDAMQRAAVVRHIRTPAAAEHRLRAVPDTPHVRPNPSCTGTEAEARQAWARPARTRRPAHRDGGRGAGSARQPGDGGDDQAVTFRSGLVGLLEEVAGAVHVDRDARAHGGGHGDLRRCSGPWKRTA